MVLFVHNLHISIAFEWFYLVRCANTKICIFIVIQKCSSSVWIEYEFRRTNKVLLYITFAVHMLIYICTQTLIVYLAHSLTLFLYLSFSLVTSIPVLIFEKWIETILGFFSFTFFLCATSTRQGIVCNVYGTRYFCTFIEFRTWIQIIFISFDIAQSWWAGERQTPPNENVFYAMRDGNKNKRSTLERKMCWAL